MPTMSTTQGTAAMAWTHTAPRQPSSQAEDGIGERTPALRAEAGLPSRRLQIQRHQGQQPHNQQGPAPAREGLSAPAARPAQSPAAG